MRRALCRALVVSAIVTLGCGEGTVDPPAGNPGTTTPSNIPFGDFPPIPVPATLGDVNRSTSDSVETTLELLATDFRPAVLALQGTNWIVGRADGGDGINLAVRTCFNTVYEGSGWSSDIRYAVATADCPLIEGGHYYEVEYPDLGAYIDTYLLQRYDAEADNGPAYRPHLVSGGAIQPGGNTQLFHELELPHYVGDLGFSVPRSACRLDGAVGPNAPNCSIRAITSASVVRQPLTNPVYLRRDVFWEKEGNSQVYANSADVEISQSFSRTWKVGTEEVQTEEFGRSVSATLGAEKGALKASVTGTLEQTFGSSVTITDAVETTETYEVTVAGNTTAVFEVWNLVERYTFANADSTAYADPNYVFAEADLTRRATITTAFVSTQFPGN